MNGIKERAEALRLKNSSLNLPRIGRMLVDKESDSLWELDTKTLPRACRKWRRKAKRFADEEIRPFALEADLEPKNFDHTELFRKAAKEGFFTTLFPRPVGSAPWRLYFRNAVYVPVIIAEEFAAADGGLALKLMAPNLGIAPILLSGHLPSIFRFFIPNYLSARFGGRIRTYSFAITEPEAGSDVEDNEGATTARLGTKARKVKGGYLLNGSKIFISNGAISVATTVFAKLEGEGIESWTCFLVEKGSEGFRVGRQERKMGQRASDASELIFENVFVPERNVIGKVRGGWPLNKNVLNFSRPAVASMAVGQARGAFESALQYVKKKQIGRKRMIEFQEVQLELAEMVQDLWAARSLIRQSLLHFAIPQSIASASKSFATDTAWSVANRAMELMGDEGYLHKNHTERFWRDIRLTRIYEGTNQLNRLAIIEHHRETDFK